METVVSTIQPEMATETREADDADTSVYTYKRIEFHPARKTYHAFRKSSGNRLETLNPDSGRKRILSDVGVDNRPASKRLADGSEFGESWLDPDLRFGMSASRIRKIGAGLENLGNTCYLNSVLQCLTYTEPLAAYLQSGKHQSSCRVAGFCALCAIQKHVSRALESSGRSLVPKDLVSNLRCISRNFRSARQEDAHEYMINLLESMHKCCLPSGIPLESPVAYEKSLVHKIFGGRLRSQVECQKCFYRSDKFDPFLDVSLEINRADSIVSALQNFTAAEFLDGGEKHYQCQRCKEKVKAKKRLTIHKVPYVLTIHLKRFHAHDTGRKVDKKVVFDPSLDLKPFSSFSHDGDLKYSLYGVLVHFGHNTHSGHYVCFVRTSSGIWYLLNDNEVRPVNEKTVLNQKAYMLFYVRDTKSISLPKSLDVVIKENVNELGGNIGDRHILMGISNKGSALLPDKIAVDDSTLSLKKMSHFRMPNILNKVVHEKCVVSLREEKVPFFPSGMEPPSRSSTRVLSDLMMSVQSIHTDSSSKDNSLCKLKETAHLTDVTLIRESAKPFSCSNNIGENSRRLLTPGYAEKMIADDLIKQLETVSTVVPATNHLHAESGATEALHSSTILSVQGTEVVMSNDVIGIGKLSSTVDAKTLHTTDRPSSLVPDGINGVGSAVRCSTSVTHLEEKNSEAYGNKPASRWKKKRKRFPTLGLRLKVAFPLLGIQKKTKFKKRVNVRQHSLTVKIDSMTDEDTRDRRRLRQPTFSGGCTTDSAAESLNRTRKNDRVANGVNKLPVSNSDAFQVANESSCSKFSVKVNNGTSHQHDCANACSTSTLQTRRTSILSGGLQVTEVARWNDVDSSQSLVPKADEIQMRSIGYIPDQWDEDYDRGKRKKVKQRLQKVDDRNPFQETASYRARYSGSKLKFWNSKQSLRLRSY